MWSSMEKNFYDQLVDSNIKRCEKIIKLTTGQGADYNTGCLLDHDYMKKHYRLIAVALSRYKELNADPKAIQQIEFIGQLKKLDDDNDATYAGADQSIVVLTNL